MGKLIDETDLMNLLYALDDARHDLCYAIKKIAELPTVEAIPKDQYEARLKADMVAMLEEIQSGIREIEEDMCIRDSKAEMGFYRWIKDSDVENIIQEKIEQLKGHKDAKTSNLI